MKNILYLFFFFYTLSAIAENGPSFEIIVRKAGSSKAVTKEVYLEDLVSTDRFEGKFFRIVKGKNKEAISFKETDQKIIQKAANVYYHLTLARRFWLNQFGKSSDQKKSTTIRIEMSHQFDDQGQFANDHYSTHFNNAVSIPAGKSPDWLPLEKQKSWEQEIWFRPMKKVESKKLPGIGPNPLTQSLEALEQPFLSYSRNRFNQSLFEHLFYPSYAGNPLWQDVVRYAGTIALTKIIIESSRHADRLFMDKYYYLDTAMIPEIIYHEYAHLMLSDYLELTHSTPVVEGMADYFAALMSEKNKVYNRVKGFSNAAPKNRQNKTRYQHWYESNRFATSDFVLAVLWDVRETIGEKKADKLIFNMRQNLRTGFSSINGDLIDAVIRECENHCKEPMADKLKLYEVFSQRGF